MDAYEREVFEYLKTWGKEYVSVKEICRRAGGKARFSEDPDWAKPVLQIMYERGLLERDVTGRYRIKPKAKKGGGGRWVSPHIAELLKKNGVEVDSNESELPNVEDFEQH